MGYAIDKMTYSDGRAYRYNILDEDGELLYVGERTGIFLPTPSALVDFFDADHNPAGRLQPPDAVPWRRAVRFEVFVGEEQVEPYVLIRERWRLVDILLLRLPRYEIELGRRRYTAQGSRYGRQFYEILRARGEGERIEQEIGEGEEETPAHGGGARTGEVKVGQIQRQAVGPSYFVETIVAPLRQVPLVTASLVILIDLEMHS
jgi:hypothetical protein